MTSNYNYISIPKTGTQSVLSVLKDGKTENHIGINGMNVNQDLFTFAFIREPIERLRSWFYWHKNNYNAEHIPEHIKQQVAIYKTTFEDWVTKGLPTHWTLGEMRQRGVESPIFQYQFVLNNNWLPKHCFIGMFESMNTQINTVMDILGKPHIALPRMGDSQKQHNDLSAETRGMLVEYLKKDYKLYNEVLEKGFVKKGI